MTITAVNDGCRACSASHSAGSSSATSTSARSMRRSTAAVSVASTLRLPAWRYSNTRAGRATTVRRRDPPAAERMPVGGLDQDDVGTGVGEDLGAVRDLDPAAGLHDAQPGERGHHLSTRSLTSTR